MANKNSLLSTMLIQGIDKAVVSNFIWMFMQISDFLQGRHNKMHAELHGKYHLHSRACPREEHKNV